MICFNASQVGKNLKDKNIYNILKVIKSIYEIAISAHSQNYRYKKSDITCYFKSCLYETRDILW